MDINRRKQTKRKIGEDGGINILMIFPPFPLCINMKTIKVKCEYCKKEVEKPTKEVNRSKKLHRKFFCNNSCGASHRNEHMPSEYWKTCKTTLIFKSHAGNRLDEFSPFRPFLSKSRASNQRHQMSLTPQQLKKIWEKQNGTCPYTGIKMVLPRTTLENHRTHSLKKASIDRIDSSKGYIDGNVEFVCMAVNLAKRDHTKEDMISFFKEITSNTLGITQRQPS
jgi:hypothetical protein